MKLDVDVHDITDLIVCNRTFRKCMIHHAQNCQRTGLLHAFLREKFDIDEDGIEDDESEQTITLKQQSVTDRAECVTRTEPVKDYIDLLVLHLIKSTEHSYTTTAQSNYLKSLKEALPVNGSIILEILSETIPLLFRMKCLLLFTIEGQVQLNLTLYALFLTI